MSAITKGVSLKDLQTIHFEYPVGLSSEIVQFKQKCLESFQKIGVPNPRNEFWKYIDWQDSDEKTFHLPLPTDEADTPKHQFKGHCVLPIKNGYLQSVHGLPGGVSLSKESALPFHTLLHDHNPMVGLCLAAPNDLVSVTVDAHKKVTQPLECLNVSSSQSAAFTCVNVHLQAESELVFVINQSTLSQVLNNSVFNFTVDEKAKLTLYVIQNDSAENTLRFDNIRITVRQEAEVKAVWFSTGGFRTRRDVRVNVVGENANLQLGGLALLNGQSHTHTHTYMDHQIGSSTSTQLFKNIISDQAINEFNGLVFVHQAAQKTDSGQLSNSLLLSDQARALVRPQLKIFADDVKCTHGANVGQLDADQLHYLSTRGLSPEEARSLLLFGFAEEILDYITLDSIKDNLEAQVKGYFQHS